MVIQSSFEHSHLILVPPKTFSTKEVDWLQNPLKFLGRLKMLLIAGCQDVLCAMLMTTGEPEDRAVQTPGH